MESAPCRNLSLPTLFTLLLSPAQIPKCMLSPYSEQHHCPKDLIVPASPRLPPKILSSLLTYLTFHTHFVPWHGLWRFSLYFPVLRQHFLSKWGKKKTLSPLFFAEWKVDKWKPTVFQILSILTPETWRLNRWISDSPSRSVSSKAKN